MFGKFQDSLLFVVLAYAIFRIGWGEGFTTMNIFILLGSLVAILSMVLRRSGYLETVEKKKKEAEEKKRTYKKGRAALFYLSSPRPRFCQIPLLMLK